MSSAITIWAGPVNHTQNGDLRWPGTEAFYVTCTGDGSGGTPRCSECATSQPLSRIAGDATEIYGAAFSAGGQYWERVLTDPRIRGLYLADGTYSMWNQGRTAPEVSTMKNRVDFAAKAAGDPGYRAVFTASSSPNKDHPTGAQTLEALAIEAQKRGVDWSTGTMPLTIGGKTVTPRFWRSKGALLLDFGSTFTHNQQVTLVAPAIWGPLFAAPDDSPATPGGGSASEGSDKTPWIVGGLLAATALGTGIAAALSSKKE